MHVSVPPAAAAHAVAWLGLSGNSLAAWPSDRKHACEKAWAAGEARWEQMVATAALEAPFDRPQIAAASAAAGWRLGGEGVGLSRRRRQLAPRAHRRLEHGADGGELSLVRDAVGELIDAHPAAARLSSSAAASSAGATRTISGRPTTTSCRRAAAADCRRPPLPKPRAAGGAGCEIQVGQSDAIARLQAAPLTVHRRARGVALTQSPVLLPSLARSATQLRPDRTRDMSGWLRMASRALVASHTNSRSTAVTWPW